MGMILNHPLRIAFEMNLHVSQMTAAYRFAIRRCVRSSLWFLMAGLVLVVGPSKSAKAQHCGRIVLEAARAHAQMAWDEPEQGDELWRIRTAACDGPLCKSSTPEPFTGLASHSGAVVPLPWKCTSALFALRLADFSARIVPDKSNTIIALYLDPLFEPPRNA